MEIINKTDNETMAAIEAITNRTARENLLKAQPHTTRNLSEMYTVDILQIQMMLEHYFNMYAKVKGIVNADICSKIVNGKFIGNGVEIRIYNNNVFKAAKIIKKG